MELSEVPLRYPLTVTLVVSDSCPLTPVAPTAARSDDQWQVWHSDGISSVTMYRHRRFSRFIILGGAGVRGLMASSDE